MSIDKFKPDIPDDLMEVIGDSAFQSIAVQVGMLLAKYGADKLNESFVCYVDNVSRFYKENKKAMDKSIKIIQSIISK